MAKTALWDRKASRRICLALVLWLALSATLGSVTKAREIGANQNSTAARQAGRALELKDYYRVESIGSPAISPDGKRVAFVRTYIVEADNRRNSEIWLAPSDGSSAPKRITDPALSSSNPRWSPDGKLLAFSAGRRRGANAGTEETSPVWFLRMDQPGGEPFQIQGVGGTPIFSPDNQWIAFTKRTPPAAKTPQTVRVGFRAQDR